MSKLTSEAEQAKPSQFLFKGNAAAIALSAAIKSLGGFVGVYLPYYFVQIGGNTPTLGLLTFAAALVQLLFLPIGGFIADNYGRRRIIVSVAFFGVIFPIFYAVVQDWRIFGLLTVFAATVTISSPATRATVVDSIPPETRTTKIAALQVVSTLPSIISPTIGGWLIQQYGLEDGFRMACVYAAVFAFVSAFPVLMLLRETLKSKARTHDDSDLRELVLSQVKPSRLTLSRNLIFLLSCFALVAFANGAVGQYYIFYALSVVGITALDWGTVVSLQLLLACILRIPGGWFSDKFGKKRAMTVSLLTTIPLILVFTLSQSFIQVVVSALLLVAAGIYYAPAYEALQADLTPRSFRGRVNALWEMSNYFAAGLGALAGGFAFSMLGSAAPFYIFAVAELLAAIVLISKVKEPEAKEV